MVSSVKILVIGDPHFDLKCLATVDAFIKQINILVSETKPDVVVVLGDILHTHEKTRVECHTRAIAWFKEMACHSHVVVLIGNHDRANNGVYLTNEHFFTGLEGYDNIVIVATGPYAFDIERKGSPSFYFVAVPYVPKGRLHEALDLLKVPISSKRPLAVFGHNDIRGAKMGSIVCRDGDVWPPDYPLLIDGHYHDHQVFGNVFIPGTPFQQTFSEDMNKGVYSFTFSEGKENPDVSRIKLKLRIKTSITKSPSEFSVMKIPDPTYELRIVIQGKQADIEAVKVSKQYKEFSKLSYVKIVLSPILDAVSLKKSVGITDTYTNLLYKKLNDDQELCQLFQDLLGDLQ